MFGLSKALRAHRILERRAFPPGSRYSEFAHIRERNSHERIKNAPRASEIVEVAVTFAADTGDMVVILTDVDGKKASLWCVDDGRSHERTKGPRAFWVDDNGLAVKFYKSKVRGYANY